MQEAKISDKQLAVLNGIKATPELAEALGAAFDEQIFEVEEFMVEASQPHEILSMRVTRNKLKEFKAALLYQNGDIEQRAKALKNKTEEAKKPTEKPVVQPASTQDNSSI